MTKRSALVGYVALSIGHMAGMIDLAALPLWIGALMEYYHLQPPQAGFIVTIFLASIVVTSMILAPLFGRLPHRLMAFAGFACAAACFLIVSSLPVSAESFTLFMLLHALAGLGAGAALSMTHGCIGRTTNPHRLFGIVNVAMGALAIVMFAIMPGLIKTHGGQILFVAFAITMCIAAIVALLFFPTAADLAPSHAPSQQGPIPHIAWLTIGTIVCLALSQAMVFSYVERIGMVRGFGEARIGLVLVVMGFINLLPGISAALLQTRLSPVAVGITGPILQAIFALSLTSTTIFPLYATPVALFVTLVIFTHTFLFGLLSKVDPSGRAVAATPAMMMVGSCIGPGLGGLIVAGVGYHGLGWAVAVIACIAVGLMLQVRRALAKSSEQPALAQA